ncbi:hypothetical protein KFE94_07210 [bacterium SCSIO 12643]|nr:hypothetical protein KFE94_07210 [bacterium SCSIO 12643]
MKLIYIIILWLFTSCTYCVNEKKKIVDELIETSEYIKKNRNGKVPYYSKVEKDLILNKLLSLELMTGIELYPDPQLVFIYGQKEFTRDSIKILNWVDTINCENLPQQVAK